MCSTKALHFFIIKEQNEKAVLKTYAYKSDKQLHLNTESQ